VKYLISLPVGILIGWLIWGRVGQSPEIVKGSRAIVEDSLPIWRERDRQDSIADAGLAKQAETEKANAARHKAIALKAQWERDSLRKITDQYAKDAADLEANPPDSALDYNHPGIRYWMAVSEGHKRIAANLRIEANLARQGDVGFLGAINSLENTVAIDQRRIKRLTEKADRLQRERDQAVAKLDTLTSYKDCTGPIGIPCPQIGVGLGMTYGTDLAFGATIGVYFPLKTLRLSRQGKTKGTDVAGLTMAARGLK
jgi:hypothetical protein